MPRVLLLCEYPTLNGGEYSLLAVLPGLRAAGFELRALAPPQGPLALALAEAQVEVIPFSPHDASGVRRPQAELRKRLAEQVGRLHADLLHANSLAMGRLSGPVAAELHLPSVAHLRDIVSLSGAAVTDLNRHCRLLAVSAATGDFHVAQGVSAEKTHVLYNGVDLQRFCPRAASGYLHRELGLSPEVPVIGAIGQLVMRKGQDVLAAAAVLLAERLPRACYVFVGARYSQKEEAQRYEACLHKTLAKAALAQRVYWLGVRRDVEKLLAEFCLLVHPSRQEPLGRVLLEAAASGVPIVATDVGGTREIFPPQAATARLVEADDAQALADAIAETVDDQRERKRLGAAARRRAVAAFDVDTAAQKLAAHYRDVLTMTG